MLNALPTLRTERLLLRPFTLADAPHVQRLAGDRQVYATTLNVPHPYTDGMAEQWIATHEGQFASGKGVSFAIALQTAGELIGAISLGVRREHHWAELGYWVGVSYWNQGYTTEAAIAVIGYGFDELGLHKIAARYMTGNSASERVMIKAGMHKEGELRDEVYKDGVFRSLGVYGIVRG